MFGKHKQAQQQAKILNTIRVTTSIIGQPIALLFGTDRIASHILDYQDFIAIPVQSQSQNSGKGGLFGGGGNSSATQTYDYQAAVMLALCEGGKDGIVRLINVWDSKGRLQLVSVSESHTVPGGGGNIAVANQGANFYDDFGVSRHDAYSVVANDYGSPAPVTLSGTQRRPMKKVVSAPAPGEYTGDGTGNFGFAAGDAGDPIDINYIYIVPPTGAGAGTGPQQLLSLTLFKGAIGQAAWAYMTSAHPGRDLGYTGLAYIAASALDLGTSASLPNYSFEISGLKLFGGGTLDCNPADIIREIITNPYFGLEQSAALLDAWSNFSDFCIANGLFLSVLLESQDTTANVIRQILEITNSEQFFSEGVLKIVPYGDTTVVGNGKTFTPQTAPVYDLTDDDFMAQRGGPVVITRPSPQDAKNRIPVEYINRANDYNRDTVYDQDDASVQQAGLLIASPLSYDYIKTLDVAQKVANHRMKRSVYIRRNFKFTLGPRYARLEPMDLVTLTDSNMGLVKEPVRLLRTQEQQDLSIQCEAEEFPWGTATATQYPKQLVSGSSPNYFADPGNINAPVLFESNNRVSRKTGYEVWMGLSGGPFWGGCDIIASVDGSTYRKIGSFQGKSRMGVTTSALGSGGNQVARIESARATVGLGPTTTIVVVCAEPHGLNGSETITLVGIDTVTTPGSLDITSGINSITNPYTFTIQLNHTSISDYGVGGSLVLSTITTLGIDLTESLGELIAGAAADAINGRTACYVGGEIISYRDATLTAANKYTLGYLVRGGFGSKTQVHASGVPFLRLDESVFVWEYDPTLIGKTISFKFLSFNQSGRMMQSEADVSPYTLALTGFFSGGARTNWVNDVGFAAAMTPNQITIYWDGTNGSTPITVYRDDGSVSAVLSGSLVIPNLNPSTHYYFYPYFNPARQAVDFAGIAFYINGIAFTQRDPGAAQLQALMNRVPLTKGPLDIQTPAGGTGVFSGTGGGGGRDF